MKVIGVSLAQLESIAAVVGVRIAERNNYQVRASERLRKDGRVESRFTLRTLYSTRPHSAPYRRIGSAWPGRKPRSLPGILCWHGHRDFMRELFKRYPEAILESVLAKYKGREGFEREYAETGYQNIDRQAFPLEIQDACRCGDDGHDERGVPLVDERPLCARAMGCLCALHARSPKSRKACDTREVRA